MESSANQPTRLDQINLDLVPDRLVPDRNPPLPPKHKCKIALQYAADKSLEAHEALRTELAKEAERDRKIGNEAAEAEQRRLAFIAKVKQCFPFVDVHWIANQIVPWDVEEFKARVAERQKEYLKESKQ
jgi:hypothetical protein